MVRRKPNGAIDKMGPRTAKERIDGHEKVLHLILDRINQLDDTQGRGRVPELIVRVAVLEEWIERGFWGRLWDRVRG